MRAALLAAATVATCVVASSSPRPQAALGSEWMALTGPRPLGLVARQQIDWCGAGQPTAVDRKPDADPSSFRQVHVTYVIPADAIDRFGSRAGPIATDVAAIDAWWRGQDASRTIRFDRQAFPGCTTKFGALDIGFVRLSRNGSAYAGEDGLDQLRRDLTPLADLPWHKHLVYYDGPNLFDESVCGATATNRVTRDSGGLDALSFVWLRSLCSLDLGAAGLIASVAVHELIHNLGAVSEGSPHECAPPNGGHVCDSTSDILTPFATGETRLATQVLDVNRDDYYAIPSGLYDVQLRSQWLSHLPQLPVQVTATGSAGTIEMTSPSALECGRNCSFDVDTGATLTFFATPGVGARLVGWSGACTGVGACTVTVGAETTATALFAPATRARLRVSVAGKGRVVSFPGGIACPRLCSATFVSGTTVRLRAFPAAGYRFMGWMGVCRGTGRCTVNVDHARTVRAAFRRA